MIVITGAAGQVGTVLVKTLVERNKHIKAIVTATDDLTSIENYPIEIVTGDIRDKQFLIREFTGADKVYHLAGIVSITPGNKDLLTDVNVGGMKNVIEACLQASVGRLIYTSSVHAFVERPHGQLIDESATIDPERVVGNYAQTKAQATLLLREAITHGLDAVIVYPSGIIGPFSHTLSNMGQMFIDYCKGRIPVLIEGTYDFVDVRDVVLGTIAAGEKAPRGGEYILSGYQMTLKQMFYILSHITGRKHPRIYFPTWLLKLFIPFINFFSKRLNKMPTLTSYALYTISSNSLFSHEKATQELGYFPRHIARTLQETIEWYEQIGKL